MAQEVGWTIDEILGWKKTDDGKHALIGLKTTDGQQLALAGSREASGNHHVIGSGVGCISSTEGSD